MLQNSFIAVVALLFDAAIVVAVIVPVVTGRVPRRWRNIIWLLAGVATLNLVQASVFMGTEHAPTIAEPALHLAMVATLATVIIIFRREVTRPDRLLDSLRDPVPDVAAQFELLPVPVAFVAPDGVIRRVNRCFEELFGRPASEMEGHSARELVESERDRRELANSLQSFVRSRGVLNAEAEYWMKTGRGLRLIHWRRAGQYDDSGDLIGIISYGDDVTEKRKTEERLALETYLLDAVHDAVSVRTLEGEMLYANNACLGLLGLSRKELFARPGDEWLMPEYLPVVLNHLHAVEQYGDDTVEVMLSHKDGTPIPLELHSQMIEYEGQPAVLIVGRDISLRFKTEDLMSRMAFTDSLTGLPNRRTVRERLAEALGRLGRSCEDLTVLYLDVDNLKSVNDSLGHEAGDRLIGMVADRLRSQLREEDMVGRVGGDEFVVVLQDVTAWSGSDEIAARLLSALHEPLVLDGHELRMNASIGIVECRPDMTPEDVIACADRAMYVAKRSGGGKYLRHSSVMDEEFLDVFTLKNDLACALERREFELLYQPLVCAVTGQPVAAEALLRWRHPERGLLLPDTFIPLAEQNGSIRDIGRWVLATACGALVEWRRQGLDLQRVSVNVSPMQLADPCFVSDIRAALSAYGLEASSLELEITETQAMEHTDNIDRIFSRLSAAGVRVALDDFGVGHSSLERLRRLPITTLKIDRTFVADLCNSNSAHPIIETILVLASNLKLNVVAEGVETLCQADYLSSAGCWELQGYAFARPTDAESLLRLCAKGTLEAEVCERRECPRNRDHLSEPSIA